MVLAPAGEALARCENWTPQARPQNTARDIVGTDLDTIMERGFITFAAYEDYPPWSYEEGGRPAGVDIEIGALIAEYIGVEPRYNLVASGENLEEDLRNQVWKGPLIGGAVSNVMLHVPYDSEFACRVEQVVFTGQYATESLAIAYDPAVYPDDAPTVPYFRYETVAVENDTLSDFFLSGAFGGQMRGNVRRFRTHAEAMAALAAGEVTAAMGPKAELEAGLTEALAIHQPPTPGLARGEWTLGVAVHHAYRALGYTVDDAIREGLTNGAIEEIFARHGLSFDAPER